MLVSTISRRGSHRNAVRRYAVKSGSPNRAIIDMLNKLREEESQKPSILRHYHKYRAFQTAIDVIEQLKTPIRSVEQARGLKGIGTGIAKRIGALLKEGADPSSKPAADGERTERQVLNEISSVPWVGATTARKLVEAGCEGVADMNLSKFQSILSPAQKIGLKYLHELEQPIRRQEAEKVLNFIRDTISSKFEVDLVGSYRRGLPKLSDIDIILFHPNYVHIPIPKVEPSDISLASTRRTVPFRMPNSTVTERENSLLLHEVIRPLESSGFIAATIRRGPSRWHGIVRAPEKTISGWEESWQRKHGIEHMQGNFRRLDFFFSSMKSRGAALLSLTGDVEFNRHIRSRALELGLHLNEYGLWRWEGEGDGNGYWALLKAETEEEILTELNMEFIEPERRNFSFILDKKGKRAAVAAVDTKPVSAVKAAPSTPKKKGRPRKVQ